MGEQTYQKSQEPLLEEANPSWTKTDEKGEVIEKINGHWSCNNTECNRRRR